MTNRKSHYTPFRLLPKSTILDDLIDRHALNCRKDGHHENLNEDRPCIGLLSAAGMYLGDYSFRLYKVYDDIRGSSLGRDIKRQLGCRQRQFSVFSLAISSETLEMRPSLLYGDKQSVVGFSVTPKMYHLEGYFALNYVLAPVFRENFEK